MATETLKALTVPYRAGEKIVAAGERGGCLFILQEGQVRLSRPRPGAGPGDEGVEIDLLGRGDVFGEEVLLGEEEPVYRCDAEAVIDCRVVEVGPATLERMVRGNPEMAVRLLRRLGTRIQRLVTRLGEMPPPLPAAPEEHGPTGRLAGPGESRSAVARLVTRDGGVEFPLAGSDLLVGRYDPVTEIQPEVDLGALDTQRSVSRRHARLVRRGHTWYLREEKGALNGTFVNGNRVPAGTERALADGDVVSFGMVRLVFHAG